MLAAEALPVLRPSHPRTPARPGGGFSEFPVQPVVGFGLSVSLASRFAGGSFFFRVFRQPVRRAARAPASPRPGGALSDFRPLSFVAAPVRELVNRGGRSVRTFPPRGGSPSVPRDQPTLASLPGIIQRRTCLNVKKKKKKATLQKPQTASPPPLLRTRLLQILTH